MAILLKCKAGLPLLGQIPPLAPTSPTIKAKALPWLVWLSGLSASLQTKWSLVGFPLGRMPWLQAGSQEEVLERQLHIDISLPLFLPPFPSKNK